MMVELYNESIHSDFEIQVNGQVFRTHRCILAHASEVFDSMFKNGMREATEGHIRLTDTTPSAVRAMLEFIYTGVIERTLFEKNTRDILIIAEKYNIASLKEECERYVGELLNLKNFVQTTMFADMYSSELLLDVSGRVDGQASDSCGLQECRRFLVAHYDAITPSREWSEFKRRQPGVVNELLEKSLGDKLTCGTMRGESPSFLFLFKPFFFSEHQLRLGGRRGERRAGAQTDAPRGSRGPN
ncbi:hypothetical protein M3Y99_01402600 [Aphelenchoides fujianensis]|nr:hypothetical protein M3Y99_01402600 [Aphelenchoides fujianensis]